MFFKEQTSLLVPTYQKGGCSSLRLPIRVSGSRFCQFFNFRGCSISISEFRLKYEAPPKSNLFVSLYITVSLSDIVSTKKLLLVFVLPELFEMWFHLFNLNRKVLYSLEKISLVINIPLNSFKCESCITHQSCSLHYICHVSLKSHPLFSYLFFRISVIFLIVSSINWKSFSSRKKESSAETSVFLLSFSFRVHITLIIYLFVIDVTSPA